jgi:hypothetical protein
MCHWARLAYDAAGLSGKAKTPAKPRRRRAKPKK